MLSDFLREKLSVDVFDKDTLTADDPLGGCAPLSEYSPHLLGSYRTLRSLRMPSLRGRCVVSLDGLRYEQSIEFTEELAQRGKGGKTHGRVIFSVSWTKLDSRMLTPGALVVTLRRGTNLAAADLGGTSDPYAKVRIGAQVGLGG